MVVEDSVKGARVSVDKELIVRKAAHQRIIINKQSSTLAKNKNKTIKKGSLSTKNSSSGWLFMPKNMFKLRVFNIVSMNLCNKISVKIC